MIRLKNVSKFYYSKGVIATGFTKINLNFKLGEFVAITGESGSGKSTLLNVISGLDTYEEGEMYVEGKETSHYIEKDWEVYRRKYIGNIYQNFNLVNSYTVYQNIDLILTLNGIKRKDKKAKILDLLKKVDMLKYKNTKVSKLSGGQKQRVAIARALAKDVPIIIADEPTGNLDKASADSVIKLLRDLAKDRLIIIVTHNYEQVEPYVTRKITMHDGRVLEDKKIKEIEPVKTELEKYTFKNAGLLGKLQLGFRNTFNIVPKFILLMIVYSFIIASIMGEYSFFKKEEYEAKKAGYNVVFQDTSDNRIVVNKKDRTSFTVEEFQELKKMKNVESIMEYDDITGYSFDFTDEKQETWFDAKIRPLDNIKKESKLIGRLPENDNELVLEAIDDGYIFGNLEGLLNKEFHMLNVYNYMIDSSKTYVIVGVIPNQPTSTFTIDQTTIYGTDNFLREKHNETHQKYSKVTVDFINEIYEGIPLQGYLSPQPNAWVPRGNVYIAEDENYRCPKFNCINQYISITVSNIYYTKTKSYRVDKVYNQKNFPNILETTNYNKQEFTDRYNGPIYLNIDDYNDLYNNDSYQISIYATSHKKVDEIAKKLEKKGYHTLKIKDTLSYDFYDKIMRVIKIVITIIFVVVLFFITYFIVKIILKSRNIYFSILRMLGASKKVCFHLLMLELFVVSNLSYFLFLLVAEINRRKLIQVGFINTVNEYFQLNDYMILYMIIMIMSFLLSARYSRKLFKNSVMNTYREEM